MLEFRGDDGLRFDAALVEEVCAEQRSMVAGACGDEGDFMGILDESDELEEFVFLLMIQRKEKAMTDGGLFHDLFEHEVVIFFFFFYFGPFKFFYFWFPLLKRKRSVNYIYHADINFAKLRPSWSSNILLPFI